MEAIKTFYAKYKIWVNLGAAAIAALLLWKYFKK